MKKTIIAVLFLFAQILGAQTIVTLSDGDNVPSSTLNTYTVPAGHVATVIARAIKGTSAELRLRNDQNAIIARIRADSLIGDLTLPAGYNIKTIATGSKANSIAFVQLAVAEVNNGSAYIPQNAVVIPTDASGPVSVILESSTDLINWAPALPGAYGANTANRFFRVRMEIQ